MRRALYAMLALGVFSSDAFADAMAGASKAQVCLLCHQPQHRLAAMPLLEGQPAGYLYAQLKSYKDKTRTDPTATMPSSAASLTDQDMREISLFLATRVAPSVGYQVDAAKAAAGHDRAVALGCGSCHLADRNANTVVPRLAGQAVGYTTAQLRAFAAGTRAHGIGSQAAPAVSLTDDDIDGLANYFAQLR